MNPNSEAGEHTRPRVWLDAPRVQHAAPPAVPRRPELFHTHRVFREGAENCTRGGCAPPPTSDFGFNAKAQSKRRPRTRGRHAPYSPNSEVESPQRTQGPQREEFRNRRWNPFLFEDESVKAVASLCVSLRSLRPISVFGSNPRPQSSPERLEIPRRIARGESLQRQGR